MELVCCSVVVRTTNGALQMELVSDNSHPALNRKGACSIVEQSYTMYNIYIYPIVFKLCMREKKKKERTKLTFTLGFLKLEEG